MVQSSSTLCPLPASVHFDMYADKVFIPYFEKQLQKAWSFKRVCTREKRQGCAPESVWWRKTSGKWVGFPTCYFQVCICDIKTRCNINRILYPHAKLPPRGSRQKDSGSCRPTPCTEARWKCYISAYCGHICNCDSYWYILWLNLNSTSRWHLEWQRITSFTTVMQYV